MKYKRGAFIMKKREFFSKLKIELKDLETNEITKIVNTYKEKLEKQTKKGISEETAIKKFGSVEKIASKYKKEPIESKIETKEEVVPKKVKQSDKKVINSKDNLKEEPSKTYTIITKEMVNLIFLIIVLVLLYFPINLVNINVIKTIQHFELDLKYIYLASTIIYSIYLIICVVSLSHYLTFITNNVNFKKANKIFISIKSVVLRILAIPSFFILLISIQALIISLFFYLDGFRVKGLPILCFGILLF
ncbi:DUF1700 domain-containing protein, partial [bacterium]|nr:DUF1700 domain-containing protein [bacterium]